MDLYTLILALLAYSFIRTRAFSAVRMGSETSPSSSPTSRSRFGKIGMTTRSRLPEHDTMPDANAIRGNSARINSQKHPEEISPAAAGLGKTAIVLNLNARAVTEDIGEMARSVFGDDHVFVTTTAEQAQQAAAKIVRNQYNLVIPVGGDGTLSGMINCMTEEIMSTNSESLDEAMRALPYMGYVPLGTGNGVGSVVGCHPSAKRRRILPESKRRRRRQLRATLQSLEEAGEQLYSKPRNEQEDVWRIPDSSSSSSSSKVVDFEIVDLPMMQVARHSRDDEYQVSKGDLCFFAGVGFDSLMLNDFKEIKAWSQRTGFLTRTLSSVMGYCVALVVKTLPKCLLRGEHNIQVKLTSRDNETLWVDHRRGDCVRRVPIGKELYSGTTGILAAGTSPFYGGGLKLFPFARMTTDKMHLRLGRINPMVGFLNIPQIFAGSYRDKSDMFGCIDFIGGDFEVEVSAGNNDQEEKGYPFQHSGESVGHVERFRLRVMDVPVRFVCL